MNRITHEGEINLGNVIVPCYVLEDGRRVLSGRGMEDSLNMVDDSEKNSQRGWTRLNRYLSQESLKPFIYKEYLSHHFVPITCYRGNTKINGYEANVLVDICNAFLEARRYIKLGARQRVIAAQCEILVSGFAKLGLIALIDEATGYQYERERDELQKLIDKYVSEELRAWSKTFPDVYYKEIFRLRGWDFTVSGINKRPSVVGRWTNTLIYEQLPDGVLEELKHKTPKSKSGNYSARFFQSLTTDIGSPHLQKQISSIVTLMQISDNWEDFLDKFNKLQERRKGQLELDLNNSDKEDF